MELRTVNVIRYISPLREGGSLPALADADDGFKYVVKFRGGGHGTKALISEFIGGQIAKILGFKIPELVLVNLDKAFGQTEGDEEIQDLLQASQGINLGLHFLSGAFAFDPVVTKVDPTLAAKIVWLDAFITNIDRTVRNTNLLVWNKELWLIDNGAALYFHHSWTNWEKHINSPFAQVKDHVLLPSMGDILEVDKGFTKLLTDELIVDIVNNMPDDWLVWEGMELSVDEIRKVYIKFLIDRRNNSTVFVQEAIRAKNANY